VREEDVLKYNKAYGKNLKAMYGDNRDQKLTNLNSQTPFLSRSANDLVSGRTMSGKRTMSRTMSDWESSGPSWLEKARGY
jgi:hypothetical protein